MQDFYHQQYEAGFSPGMKHLQSSKIWPHWPLALGGLLLIEGVWGF